MSAFILSNNTPSHPPKICSFKFLKIFLEGFPFRLGVMILHLTSQLQIIVSLPLLYLCRLSKDLPWMVSSWQHFATVWKTQFGCYEMEISSLKVWINSEISIQLFKSTEIVSVTPRLLLLLLPLFAFTSFFSALNCFLAISSLHGYSMIPALQRNDLCDRYYFQNLSFVSIGPGL